MEVETGEQQAKDSAAVGWEHAKDAKRGAYDRVTKPGTGSVVAGSTRDRVEGTYDQVAGAVQEKTGAVIGDRELQAKGMFQKAEGHVEEGVGDAKREFGK